MIEEYYIREIKPKTMKRVPTLVILLLLMLNSLRSQTIVITFDGTVNASPIPLDSIVVMNLTQGGDTTIYFPDNVLVLGTVGLGGTERADDLRLRSLPNPFAGRTDVLLDAQAGDLVLTLLDATGRSLATLAVAPTAGTQRFGVHCGVPGVHYLTAVQGGVSRTVRLVAMEGSGKVELVHLGGLEHRAPKDDRNLFSWVPGDALRYIGYATSEDALHSAAIDEVPVASAMRTFVMAAGAVCPEAPTVTDVEGNVYATVRIGEQCWMAENLRTSQNNDGTPIPNVIEGPVWGTMTSGAWCNFDNDSSYDSIFGKLYNWYAAADPHICPEGWHVPADAEWQQLELTLGMPADELGETGFRGDIQNVGGKMKKISALWSEPNLGPTNESGFSNLPGGQRYFFQGAFYFLGSGAFHWTLTEVGIGGGQYRGMTSYDSGVFRDVYNKRYGLCIRCVKD